MKGVQSWEGMNSSNKGLRPWHGFQFLALSSGKVYSVHLISIPLEQGMNSEQGKSLLFLLSPIIVFGCIYGITIQHLINILVVPYLPIGDLSLFSVLITGEVEYW